MLEMSFKTKFLRELQERLPDVDLDFIDTRPNHRSYPDTFVIGPLYWAALEFKRTKRAPHQPNQAMQSPKWNGAREVPPPPDVL